MQLFGYTSYNRSVSSSLSLSLSSPYLWRLSLSILRFFHLRSARTRIYYFAQWYYTMIIVEMQRGNALRLNVSLKLFALHEADDVEIKASHARTHASARISRFPRFCHPFFSLSTQD